MNIYYVKGCAYLLIRRKTFKGYFSKISHDFCTESIQNRKKKRIAVRNNDTEGLKGNDMPSYLVFTITNKTH